MLCATAAVAPVVLTGYVGHQSLHPLMPLLQPYTPDRMKRVVAASMFACVGIYLAVAIGGVAAFGAGVDVNILNNLYTGSMAPLLGGSLSQVGSVFVQVVYCDAAR